MAGPVMEIPSERRMIELNCRKTRLLKRGCKSLLRYDPLTGEFFRLVATTNSVPVGDRAGSIDGKGYWRIQTEKNTLVIAWHGCTCMGIFPNRQLDHINRDKADCSIANLREATPPQNNANSKARGRSGLKGVYAVWQPLAIIYRL